MNTLQPSAGGQPPPPSRSFSEILRCPSSPFNPKPSSLYKGKPAVSFSEDDVRKYSEPFHFTLVGKFSNGRPPMESLRKSFNSIGFSGNFTLGLIDFRHILIRFDCQEDYFRCWKRGVWSLAGFQMRVTKWHPNFTIETESPLVPVWINLPLLPIHLYNKEALYSIAHLIGEPLKIDAATESLTRPSQARICIELDLMKERCDEVYISLGSYSYWQKIVFENVPLYCSSCYKIGHQMDTCRKEDSRKALAASNPATNKNSDMPKGPVRKEYRPVQRPPIAPVSDLEVSAIPAQAVPAIPRASAASSSLDTRDDSGVVALDCAVSAAPYVVPAITASVPVTDSTTVALAVFQPPVVPLPPISTFQEVPTGNIAAPTVVDSAAASLLLVASDNISAAPQLEEQAPEVMDISAAPLSGISAAQGSNVESFPFAKSGLPKLSAPSHIFSADKQPDIKAASSSVLLPVGNSIIYVPESFPSTNDLVVSDCSPPLAVSFFPKPIFTKTDCYLPPSASVTLDAALIANSNSSALRQESPNFLSTPSSPTILVPENPLKISLHEDSLHLPKGMFAQYQCVSDVEDYDIQGKGNLIQDFEDFKNSRTSLDHPVPITPVNLKKRRTRKQSDRTVITRLAAKADNQSIH